MSKPIPDHITAKAREAVSEALGGKKSLDEFSTPIALAILAAVEDERAECLALVAPYKHRDTGYDIYEAICNRKGS